MTAPVVGRNGTFLFYIVPASMVEDVEPPLPPEPQTEGWYKGLAGVVWWHEGDKWSRYGTEPFVKWAEAHKYGPFVRLVAIDPNDQKQMAAVADVLDGAVADVSRWGLSNDILRALTDGAE